MRLKMYCLLSFRFNGVVSVNIADIKQTNASMYKNASGQFSI